MPNSEKKEPDTKTEPICRPMHTHERYILKFGRFCAWSLLALIVLYFISGWGITRSGDVYRITNGLLNRQTSFWIHEVLIIPTAFAFLCHVLIAIRLAMIRWNVRNKVILNYIFIGVGVVIFALVCWIYFS